MKCENCNIEFVPIKVNQRFCSLKCRESVRRKRERVQPDHKYRKRCYFLRCRYGHGADLYYFKKLAEQNNKCAICGQEQGDTLGLDHNHITGQWRGLLCDTCNMRMSLLEDQELVAKMMGYLKSYGN